MLLSMFSVGLPCSVIVRQTPGDTLAIGEGIRMRVGYGAVKLFLCNKCFFSLLAFLLCGRTGGICVEGGGTMWRLIEGQDRARRMEGR